MAMSAALRAEALVVLNLCDSAVEHLETAIAWDEAHPDVTDPELGAAILISMRRKLPRYRQLAAQAKENWRFTC